MPSDVATDRQPIDPASGSGDGRSGTDPSDDVTLFQALTDFVAEFLATVTTLLATLGAYAAWAMDWPLAFVTAIGVATVGYAIQIGGLWGAGSPAARLARSASRVLGATAVIGGALSLGSGRVLWAVGCLGLGVIGVAAWLAAR